MEEQFKRGEDRSVKNPPSIVMCNFQLFVIAFLVLFSVCFTNGAKSRRYEEENEPMSLRVAQQRI